MNKAKLSRAKRSLVSILSLGSLAIGLGCICLALIKIGLPTAQLAKTYSSSASSLPTLVVNQLGLIPDDAAPIETGDPFDIVHPEKNLYPLYPAEGDEIGSLSIPALELELPILQGTDEDELENGVGHFMQSVLPGEEDNCVLSGHRTTVFTTLGEVKIGDQLIVQTSAGTFTYEVSETRIVDKDDKTVIVPTDHAVLTLTTCYPFVYIGSAPDRFIVSANLVPNK